MLIKLFIYHIELQRISYDFINQIYSTYYKVIRNKEIIPYDGFFEVHNSDLFVLIYLFIEIFFSIVIINKLNRQNFIGRYLKNEDMQNFKTYYIEGLLSVLNKDGIKNIKKVKVGKYLFKSEYFNSLYSKNLIKLEILDNKYKELQNIKFSFFDFIMRYFICASKISRILSMSMSNASSNFSAL